MVYVKGVGRYLTGKPIRKVLKNLVISIFILPKIGVFNRLVVKPLG